MRQTNKPCIGFQYLPFIVLAVYFSIAPITGFCQSPNPPTAPTPLLPAAQEEVNKGIIAAKVPDYLLAIRFFEEARKLAPAAPLIYLNLGLAESKIPGRELRAIAWLSAYLAADPMAPNAAAVKEQITVLDVRNQSNTSRLIKLLQDAAREKLPDEPRGSFYEPGEKNDSYLYDTAKLWIQAGDIAAALKTVSFFYDPNPGNMFSSKGHTLRDIAIAQAEGGNIVDAKKTASLILDERGKQQAHQLIAKSQAASGDISGAGKTADLIKDDWGKSGAQQFIAEAQAKAGDMAGAQITYAASLKTADHIKDASKSRLQAQIAESQTSVGDIVGAQRTLADAQKTAGRLKDEYSDKAIAEAQSKVGIATAGGSQQITQPSQAGNLTAVVLADWLTILDDAELTHNCPLNTEPFLNLADYLKTLSATIGMGYPGDAAAPRHSEQVFKMLHETAAKIVGAQNVIHLMLKSQARK